MVWFWWVGELIVVFIVDDLLYYYNDSCLIKMKGNDLVVNLYKDNYYKGNGGWGVNVKCDLGFYK